MLTLPFCADTFQDAATFFKSPETPERNVYLSIKNPLDKKILSEIDRFPGTKKYLGSRANWSGHLCLVQNDLNVHLYRYEEDFPVVTIVIDRIGRRTVDGLFIVLRDLVARLQSEFKLHVKVVKLFVLEVSDSYTTDLDEYR